MDWVVLSFRLTAVKCLQIIGFLPSSCTSARIPNGRSKTNTSKWRRKAALMSVSGVRLEPRCHLHTVFLSSEQNHVETVGGDPGDRHPDAGVWRPHATGGFWQPLGRHHKGLDQSETEPQDRGTGLAGQREPLGGGSIKRSLITIKLTIKQEKVQDNFDFNSVDIIDSKRPQQQWKWNVLKQVAYWSGWWFGQVRP